MGLDVTAYSNLIHIGKHEKDPELNEGEPGGVDDHCYYDGHIEAFAYDCFPSSFRGIPVIESKTIGGATFLCGGCYAITAATETHQFSNTYGGYNQWRADLQRQFNPNTEDGKPFYELIWFADNEGAIGPDAARDLLADFEQHAEQYQPTCWPSHVDVARRYYDDFTKACRLAAAGGLIDFH